MLRRGGRLLIGLSALVLVGETGCTGRSPGAGDSAPGEIRFVVDGSRSHPISRFIYGLNVRHTDAFGTNDTSATTLNRLGGNRFTAYNWVTNESNCGADCGDAFPNDLYLSWNLEDPLERGAFVRSAIEGTLAHGTAGLVVTVPIAGYVAADHGGSTLPLPVAPDVNTPAVPNAHFKRSQPSNPRGPDPEPDASEPVVYQDDFVKWIERDYGEATKDPLRPIFFQLDNEPDLWGSTHPQIRGLTRSGEPALLGFEELVTRTVDYAAAIKDVIPSARVLSPPIANWFGFWGLGHEKRPAGYDWYIDYYLDRLREAHETEGRRLVDVLAVHWYPEGLNECRPGETPCWSDRFTNDWQPQTPSVIEARLQGPRSLWDPGFTEKSWVSENVPGCWGLACPVQLLPRLKTSIDEHYPGTGIAVTEYYFGRGGDISGGIAQADVLGVFGREGVTAAALWPAAQVYAWNAPDGTCYGDVECSTLAYECVLAAFAAYLDYDGEGGRFGDMSISAVTNDVERTSVYASVDTSNPGRMVMMALNKTPVEQAVEVAISDAGPFSRAEVYRVTQAGSGCSAPEREPDVRLAEPDAVRVRLPPMSIGAYVFRP